MTLLCAAAAAIGASRGWYGASWWTNGGRGKEEGGADLFNERLNISTSGVSRVSWGLFVLIFLVLLLYVRVCTVAHDDSKPDPFFGLVVQ